jgi:hypothetical protein
MRVPEPELLGQPVAHRGVVEFLEPRRRRRDLRPGVRASRASLARRAGR